METQIGEGMGEREGVEVRNGTHGGEATVTTNFYMSHGLYYGEMMLVLHLARPSALQIPHPPSPRFFSTRLSFLKI